MRIYFSASIAGGRDFEKYQQRIVSHLQSMGHRVLTEHVSNPAILARVLSRAKKSANPLSYLSNRDKRLMRKAEVVISECSQASLGVGFEICYALYVLKIPVLALRHKKAPGKPSAMIFGETSRFIKTYFYDDRNLEEVLVSSLNRLKPLRLFK